MADERTLMKPSKLFYGLGLAAAIVAVVIGARAASYTFLGSMVEVDDTTSNSVALAAGTFTMPSGYFLIQNGGLTATNMLHVNIQVSIDGTNFVTVATYWPSATNATTERFVPSYSLQTLYLRAQAVTSNTVTVGTSYQY